MKPKKPKASEPSLRTKLSKSFHETLEQDFRLYGKNVIEQMRQSDPTRYAELAGKLIMATEPPAEGIDFKNAQSMHEIGTKLLQSFGVPEPADIFVEQAIAANDQFVLTLKNIAACAQADEGQIQ